MTFNNISRKVLAATLTGFMAIGSVTACSTTGARDAAQQQAQENSTAPDKSESGKSDSPDSSKNSSAASFDTSSAFSDRDLESSYKNEDVSKITLKDGGSASDSKNVTIDGDNITIKAGGTYILSGTLTNGQIAVDAGEDKVELVLDGTDISNKTSAAIFGKAADKIFVTTTKGSKNTLKTTGKFADKDNPKIDSTIFSKTDLVLKGEGSLTVSDDYGHGIVSKDELKLTGGTLSVSAKKKGLQGKDSICITKADIKIDAGTEGMEGAIVYIKDGSLNVNAADDAINAANSDNEKDAMKADDSTMIRIDGGKLALDAAADAIDTNGTLLVNGGETYISGPTDDGNGSIDATGGSTITGGTVIAAGSSGMAENFGQDSTQGSILVTFEKSTSGKVTLKDSNGKTLASFTPSKEYSSALISTSGIEKDGKYTVTGGSETVEVDMGGSLIYGESRGFGQGGMGRGKGGSGSDDGNVQRSFPGKGDQNGNGEMTPPDGDENENGQMTPPDGGKNGDRQMAPPDGGKGGRDGDNGRMMPPDGGRGGHGKGGRMRRPEDSQAEAPAENGSDDASNTKETLINPRTPSAA